MIKNRGGKGQRVKGQMIKGQKENGMEVLKVKKTNFKE